MLLHYIKNAFRNIVKYKLQSIINIIGISIGLISFIFGYQWFKYETSYDSFFPRSTDIYEIIGIETQTGKKTDRLPFVLIEALKRDFPEVEQIIPLYERFGSNFKVDERLLSEAEEEFIDESFFEYFPPNVICGQQTGLGAKDEDLIITRSYAIKNFGSPEEALNVKITGGYTDYLEVVSVIDDYPENSMFHHVEAFHTDVMTRKHAHHIPENLRWKQNEVKLYVCLNTKSDKTKFKDKLVNYLVDNNYNTGLQLEAVTLTAVRHTLGTDHSFNINYIRIFVVATFILLVCVLFNFINLWVNNIYNRIKEMRLRHSIGAGRISLVFQLLMEVVIQFVFILILSCCLIELLLPLFIKVFDIKVETNYLWSNFLITYFISLLIIILISLPSLLAFIRRSALQLSGGVQAHQIGFVRNVGMIFQMGICVAFMFCALCISHQVYYMMNKDLGFKKNGLIYFIMTNRDREATVREFESIPLITNFTGAGILRYSHEPYVTNLVNWEGKPEDYKPNFQIIDADSEFVRTFELDIVEGEMFGTLELSKDRYANGKQVLINEEAARIIGIDNIVGGTIQRWNGMMQNGTFLMKDITVVGIIKNFQSASFRNPILPQIIEQVSNRYGSYTYFVRVPEDKENEGIKQIRAAFKKQALDVDPEPEIYTMNEIFSQLHKSEEGSLRLFVLLAILSVIISLFGIYSISYSTMQRRRKEVAVRKVMGGSTRNIIRMFICEYLRIVVVANILFIPFSWYFIHKWIQQFSYRAPIGWGELIIVIALSTLFVLLTILGHILKVSSENPAEVVKSE
ncbi:ABC transporter permease [Bacteroides sp. 519]|uniref:ABC transporter permease n=1 Tax=Bacteroides sp. 519 TaxID=2302937 RepID=UPI0013D6A2F9|nr:FtsX-like permease family protein [Bacteroides sp. 519]NDV59568.1 ABC transporter permease [Bacteroides sp. 519]